MFEAFKIDPSELPPTARLISLILQNHADEYEPKVLAQLYEVLYGYITTTLEDAQLFADHSHHKEVTVNDVKLAIETKTAYEYCLPPSRQSLMQLAEKKNSIPLPLVPEKFGLRLPPERHLLIKPNINVVSRKQQSAQYYPVQQQSPSPHLQSNSLLQGSSMGYQASPLSQPQRPNVSKPSAADDDYDMEDD